MNQISADSGILSRFRTVGGCSKFLRRPEAANYLKDRYGHGSPRTLAKLATLGGGPVFRKFGRIVVYTPDDLDAWATSKLSGPMRSTSDKEAA